MRTCQVCGREADKLRDTFEVRSDGVPVSKMACRACHADWLAQHGPKPERVTSEELLAWKQAELLELA